MREKHDKEAYMSLLVDVAALVLSLSTPPITEIPWLEDRYLRVQVKGVACASPEDLVRIFEVSVTLSPQATIADLVVMGWKQNILCDYYDTTMLQIGPVSAPEGIIKWRDATYHVYQMLFGHPSHYSYLYIAYSLP